MLAKVLKKQVTCMHAFLHSFRHACMHSPKLVNKQEIWYGQRHQNTITTHFEIGQLHQNFGDIDRASEIFGSVHSACRELFGEDHELTKKASLQRQGSRQLETTRAGRRASIDAQSSKGWAVVSQIRGQPGSAHCNDLHLLKFNSFSTLGAAQAHVSCGKVFYEVKITELGYTPQFGWADGSFDLTISEYSELGVGDDIHSWAWDGVRLFKMNQECVPWGKPWPPLML